MLTGQPGGARSSQSRMPSLEPLQIDDQCRCFQCRPHCSVAHLSTPASMKRHLFAARQPRLNTQYRQSTQAPNCRDESTRILSTPSRVHLTSQSCQGDHRSNSKSGRILSSMPLYALLTSITRVCLPPSTMQKVMSRVMSTNTMNHPRQLGQNMTRRHRARSTISPFIHR